MMNALGREFVFTELGDAVCFGSCICACSLLLHMTLLLAAMWPMCSACI